MFQLENKKEERNGKKKKKTPPGYIADKIFAVGLTNFIVMML